MCVRLYSSSSFYISRRPVRAHSHVFIYSRIIIFVEHRRYNVYVCIYIYIVERRFLNKKKRENSQNSIRRSGKSVLCDDVDKGRSRLLFIRNDLTARGAAAAASSAAAWGTGEQ